MFMKAFMPATYPVPLRGMARTCGGPYLGQPAPGWSSIPAKIVASRTDTKVKKADPAANLASVLKVRGKEQIQEMTATIALKPTVHMLWFVMVLRYFEPVKQWKPWMKVLFKMNMTAVNHHAHRFPQKMT